MNRSELFEVMELGPVWELRHSQPEVLPQAAVVVLAPEVQMVGNQPDTGTQAGLLLAGVLAALAPKTVVCYGSGDSLDFSSKGRVLVFGEEGLNTLDAELKQIAVCLPALQTMLNQGELKASVWRAIASLIDTATQP